MPDLGVPEIIIIAVVVLILFGSKKLPDAARSLGRSMRIFKAETRGLHDDEATHVEPRPLPSSTPTAADQTTVNGRPLDAERERTETR